MMDSNFKFLCIQQGLSNDENKSLRIIIIIYCLLSFIYGNLTSIFSDLITFWALCSTGGRKGICRTHFTTENTRKYNKIRLKRSEINTRNYVCILVNTGLTNVTTSELTLKDTELNHQNSLFSGGIANNIPFDLWQDQKWIFPYHVNTFSNRKVVRSEKNIS